MVGPAVVEEDGLGDAAGRAQGVRDGIALGGRDSGLVLRWRIPRASGIVARAMGQLPGGRGRPEESSQGGARGDENAPPL